MVFIYQRMGATVVRAEVGGFSAALAVVLPHQLSASPAGSAYGDQSVSIVQGRNDPHSVRLTGIVYVAWPASGDVGSTAREIQPHRRWENQLRSRNRRTEAPGHSNVLRPNT